jgi:CDGSH-type Zn-finger protein
MPNPEHEVTITVSRDGPLLLRGRLRILNASGETTATADAAALCRCGATANPPFCDGSHTQVGFVKP